MLPGRAGSGGEEEDGGIAMNPIEASIVGHRHARVVWGQGDPMVPVRRPRGRG